MKRRLLVAALLCLSTGEVLHAMEAPGAPYGLMCELLRYPEQAVITDAAPEFGWIVNDDRRNAVQTAYQILVASREDNLGRDHGDGPHGG